MKLTLLILSSLCLCACQSDAIVEPELDREPVIMVMWEKPNTAPRVLQAGRVQQDMEGGVTVTHCEEVMLRVPLGDGEIVITAPYARMNEQSGLITFRPPIHLSGAVEGRPMQGRAKAGSFQTKGMILNMAEVEWVHNGQWLAVKSLTLADEWRSRIAEQPSSRPAPSALTAGQSALPYPLGLPRFRRKLSDN